MSAREAGAMSEDEASRLRRVGVSMEEAGIAAQILGLTVDQAAEAIRRFADEFHPEKVMHDIAQSFTPEELAELQRRVRVGLAEDPTASLIELMLDHGAAIEAERSR